MGRRGSESKWHTFCADFNGIGVGFAEKTEEKSRKSYDGNYFVDIDSGGHLGNGRGMMGSVARSIGACKANSEFTPFTHICILSKWDNDIILIVWRVELPR